MTDEHFEEHLVVSRAVLDAFSDDVGSLWCPSLIPIVEREMTSLEFCRDFVSKSRPCILRGDSSTGRGISLPRWTVEDLQSLCGDDLEITVNVTPDGHGDAIRMVQLSVGDNRPVLERAFVLPEERSMKLRDFVRELRTSSEEESSDQEGIDSNGLPILNQHRDERTSSSPIKSVHYYSMQNDCLRTEFEALLPQLSTSSRALLEWAEAAFGTGPPDALNLWVGKQDATSSLHKDHYENLFFVASGQKVFTIYPPADAAFLPVETLVTSRFEYSRSSSGASRDEKGHWRVVPEMDNDGSRSRTPWIASPNTTRDLHPIRVEVQAGDVLYLPALWFHQVTQTCETVAVNWWFDMHFDSPLWCYFQLLESSRLVNTSTVSDGKTNDGK